MPGQSPFLDVNPPKKFQLVEKYIWGDKNFETWIREQQRNYKKRQGIKVSQSRIMNKLLTEHLIPNNVRLSPRKFKFIIPKNVLK
ncbi:MAG: hypothetical protein JRL30_26000 [Deltaproteobacteria bacterium]|nr:hypothetical protein [Deltaproteobacteria bacterium]